MVSQSHPSLTPGSLFEGRYEILSKLGEGGFGTVHKARQLTTGQPVALKTMRLLASGDADARAKRLARFEREMKLCGQLHHPNIVQLIDSGRTEEGLLYTVFAFAPGDNLADVLAREGALSAAETQHLMLQVLDALACAHSQGVIHRDLKPRNIMVVPTGARRNAVVLDFGIGALDKGLASPELTRLTGTHEIVGTPGYAAPEQLRGQDPSPRSDLFSWGLILIECLTGERVYRGSSSPEILYAQLNAEPVPVPPMLERHPLRDILRQVLPKDLAVRRVAARPLFAALEACDLRAGHTLPRPPGRVMFTFPAVTDNLSSASWPDETLHWSQGSPALAADTPGAALEGERRQITALCCTLDLAMTGSRTLDIEELDELLHVQLARCAELAQRHHGHIAAALGDQVLVYFGYPQAEEDDGPRAARVALALMAAVQRDSERLRTTRGVSLTMRIGIHTGVVVVQERHGIMSAGFVMGVTPVIAMRLSREAGPGAIAVTAETQRLLRGGFELDTEDTRAIEGFTEPMRLFRLHRERGAGRATPPSLQDSTPLVGRAQEMAILLERWSRACRGAGQCSLITGDPGIGKSRLGRELRLRVADEPHTFLEARCAPDTRNTVLHPVVEMLNRALKLDLEPTPAARVARLEDRLAAHGFALPEAMPLFLPLLSLPPGAYPAPDISPQRHKERTLNAVLSLLFAMADEQPLLILVEDLHWADATTLELLAQLVHDALSAPMCVLLTARSEFTPSFPTAGMLQLHLSRLERPEVEAMVKEMGGNKTLPPAVLEQVTSRADGVPLFVEELVHMMVESGVLIEHEDRYELARPLSDAEIPGTLRDLLMARLDRLGRAKETAQRAAALGREFGLALLAAVSPLDAESLQEDLDQLRDSGLIHRNRRLKDPSYAFKHALIRDAAYESLPKASRKKVHALIARTLEEQFPETAASRPDLLAHHHAAADQRALGIPYAHKAAMDALGRSSCVEAIEQARTALDWLDAVDDPRQRAEQELALHGVLIPALMTTQGYAAPAVGTANARARQLCEKLGASAQLFPVIWGLGAYYAVRADLPNASELGDSALEVARDQGDPAFELPARLLSGGTQLWLGNLEAARAHLIEGIRAHDPEAHAGMASVYSYDPGIASRSYLSLTLWFLGQPERAVAMAREAADLAAALDHGHTTIHTLVRATQLNLLRRDARTALGQAERIMAMADEHGFALWQAMGAILRGWARCELGDAELGIADMRAGIQEWADTGADVHRAWFATVLADACRRQGRIEDGLAVIAETHEITERTRDCLYEAESHRVHGELLLLGDAHPAREDDAEACFARALSTARAQQARALELRAATSVARLWQRRGDADQARRVLREVCDAFDRELDTPDLGEARALLESL